MMNRRSFLLNALTLSAAQSAARGFAATLPGATRSNPFVGMTAAKAMALEQRNLDKYSAEIDNILASGPFWPDWDSLHAHKDAEWFRDAKFGIYSH